MRMLFTTEYFSPSYIGGAEISAFSLCSKLAEKGLDVSILTHCSPETPCSELTGSLKIFREHFVFSKPANIVQRALFYLHAMMIIGRYILKNKPDVVMTQQLIAVPTAIVSGLFRIPTVIIVRDYWPVCYYRSLLKPNEQICSSYDKCPAEIFSCTKAHLGNSLKKLRSISTLLALPYSVLIWVHAYLVKNIIKKGNAIVAVSQFVKNILEQNGFNPRRIHVVYNPVSIRKESINKGRGHCPFHILFVGVLDLKKGLRTLINAMPQVCSVIEKVSLVVVGEGPLKTYFENLVKRMRLEQSIQFLGNISNSHLFSLYESCSIVVVPSIWPEAFGRVVAEAILHNRPIVASDIGGIPELIKGNTLGILVPPNNEKSLADAIISLANTYKAANRCSVSAHGYTQKFSVDTIASEFIEIIKSIR